VQELYPDSYIFRTPIAARTRQLIEKRKVRCRIKEKV